MRAKLLTLLFVCGFQSRALSLVPVFTKNFVVKVTKAKTLGSQSSQKERYGQLGSEERGSGSHGTKRTTATVGKTATKSLENDEDPRVPDVRSEAHVDVTRVPLQRDSNPHESGCGRI